MIYAESGAPGKVGVNISDALTAHARRRPHHPAVVWRGGQIDYLAFDRAVNGAALFLIENGVDRGDVVGVSLSDSPAYAAFLFAIPRMGAIVLPVDRRWTQFEKGRVARHFGAELVLVEANDPNIEGVSCCPIAEDFIALVQGEQRCVKPVREPNVPMVVSLSSGTTGRPRGPSITHENLFARFMIYFLSLTINEHDRFACTAPLYFGGGRALSMCVLYAGGTLVLLPPPFRTDQLIREIVSHGCTSGMMVPTLIRRLMELPDDGGPVLPAFRSLISTGSVLHPDERETALARISPRLFNFYGSTEGGGVAVLSPYHPAEKRASAGSIVFGTEMRIVDGEFCTLQPGEIGRICYRSAGSATSFFKDPDASADAFRDGWYFPGDLGYLDTDGFLYITGREKEVINRGGVNVYPTEVETAILSHPAVTDAAVIDIPSKEFGEEVAAFVCAAQELDLEQLRLHCMGRLAPYKVPRFFFRKDELPKTTVGKTDKRALREELSLAAAGEGQSSSARSK